MENTCNNSTERKSMATKANDPSMAAFVQTLKAMFQEAAAGKRLVFNPLGTQQGSIFIGKDYKVLTQMSHPHLTAGMGQNYYPKPGLVDALKAAGLTLQEEFLKQRFFCVTKAGCEYRLIFWINSDN